MQAHIQIRIALTSDAAAVCDVLRRSIVECCIDDHRNDAVILNNWLNNKNTDTVASWLASPANFPVVAEVEGQIAGIALLTRKGRIALCYIAPEMRFSGVGSALLAMLELQAAAWKLPCIQVASTMTAREFYLRRGYVERGEEASCFGIRTPVFDKKIDARSGGTHGLPPRCPCAASRETSSIED